MGKSVFLAAAIVTTVIFLMVFFLVRMQESFLVDEASKEITLLYEEQQANKILQSYLDRTDENTCIIYEKQISRQLNRIYALFYQLEKIKTNTFAVSSDSVKRQYLLASMSLWIDLKNAGKTCKISLEPVLYFFPERSDCVKCDAMMAEFEELKAKCRNVRIFAFPFESTSFEFVELLKKDYNVLDAPAMVIENNVFYDIVPMEKLKSYFDCNSD